MSSHNAQIEFEPNRLKCVIVVDAELPAGMLANAAAIVGASLGAGVPGIIGSSAIDGSGISHPGLANVPLPVLQASRSALRSLRANALESRDMVVFDFPEPARQAKTYQEYLERMIGMSSESIDYVALGLYGPVSLVNKVTGQLKLLR